MVKQTCKLAQYSLISLGKEKNTLSQILFQKLQICCKKYTFGVS